MRKYLLVLCFILILLVGCSTDTPNNEGQVESVTETTEPTVLVSNKDVISNANEGYWETTQYLENTLYYSVSKMDESTRLINTDLFTKSSDDLTKVMLSRQNVLAGTLILDEEGNIYYLFRSIEEGKYYHVKESADGTEIYREVVDNAAEYIDNEGIASAIASDDGYCILTTQGTCLFWNLQGKESGQVAAEWFHDGMDYYLFKNFGVVKGIYGAYIFRINKNIVVLQRINCEAGYLNDVFEIQLPLSAVENNISMMPIQLFSGYTAGLYINTKDILYLYDDIDREMTELIDWSNSPVNVNMDYISAIGESNTGEMIFAGYDSGKQEGTLIEVEKKLAKDVQRNTLTVGIFHNILADSITKYINDFNAAQSEIIVELKIYEDLTAFHLDLIRGQGPDILNTFMLDIDEYTQKGILENLSMYMETSEALKEDDILPAIRECMSCDGGIRFLTSTFSIQAMLVQKDVFQEGPLSIDSYLKQKNTGDGYLCDVSYAGMFYDLYPMVQTDYLNWEDKTCNFNDGQFQKFIEDILKADLIPVGEVNQNDLSIAQQLYDGTVLSSFVEIRTVPEYFEICEIFEDYAEIKGYPNSKGEDIYPISFSTIQFGINSASEKKEEAWRFIEYYILERAEVLLNSSSSFSILKDVFESQLNSLNSESYIVEPSQFTGEKEIYKFEITDEDRDYIHHMVDNACWDNVLHDGTVGKILYSESYPCLTGEKSIENTIDIIQSRVSIYMAE